MTDFSAMTGLEQMQYILSSKFDHIASIGQTMNFQLTDVSEGRAVFEGTPTDAHLNPMGGVHGGWVATLLDSITGCATHTTLNPGESYGTSSLEIKMIKPLKPGQLYRGEGLVMSRGRRVVNSTGRVTEVGSDRLVGYCTCSCVVSAPR